MKIEKIKVSDLKPYENNAKIHTKEQVEQIKKSIQEFGFNDPIAVDENNMIVEGHGRLMAVKALGYTEVDCIRLDGMTDEQKRAYIHVHNQLTLNTGFDLGILEAELKSIENIDMGVFGFDIDFDIDTDFDVEANEDDFEAEPHEEPKAKLGDIYKLGRHRLMCGDSTDVQNLEKLFDGSNIDLVLTDPPYGIDIVQGNKVGGGGVTHFGKVGGENIVQASTYIAIKGDDTTDTARDFYSACVSVGIKNFILFGGNYFADFLPPKACWLVWDKENTGNFADVELAWSSFDKGAKLYRWLWNGLCRKGERSVEGKSRVHPTQKPVGLMGKILKDFSEPGQNIFDGFGGSGSTLIACEQTVRNCFMIEYEPHYIDVIIDRWEKFTGEKAVLLNGNR